MADGGQAVQQVGTGHAVRHLLVDIPSRLPDADAYLCGCLGEVAQQLHCEAGLFDWHDKVVVEVASHHVCG